jgi:hypothetical protein
VSTLAEELPKEQERVRELISVYQTIGAPGAFAVAMMKAALYEADKASASGDVVGMIRALEDLRGFNS